MEYDVARRVPCPPRRMSSEFGANVSLQDGELNMVHPTRETRETPGGPRARRTQRSNSMSQVVHQRHMPMEPGKFHIPRKSKENKALLKHISTESREYDDVMSILTSSYIDSASGGCFTYSCPRLVHSEQLEKEFVEKRREMKAEGRTEKELEESYCFLLTEEAKVLWLCEKGLTVGHTWLSLLGDTNKGVYLCRYSDLLQVHPLTPGAKGELLIFKVMKGKVKSIYDMKKVMDPTPRFDSHLPKNASNVTSVTSFRAFEFTQQYFYEYAFDELRQRPRQVCPYAVVSMQFQGKVSLLPSIPLAPVRQNSRPSEASQEGTHFTVWSGDLVHSDETIFQISLRSTALPFLPHKLPERLEMRFLMRLDKVTKLLSAQLFSCNLYSSSKEVVSHDYHCSLLEAVDRSRSTSGVTTLLQELEVKRSVLVTPLTERGFLFLLSSVQMATPPEREEGWKRCLQALFVFPESRDVAKSTSSNASSFDVPCSPGDKVMPGLKHFIPALHHALIKARANPTVELSAGVEQHAQEYLISQKEGKVRMHSMGTYDVNEDKRTTPFPVPKHHQLNVEGYMRSYLHSPNCYQLSVGRARKMVEVHCAHIAQQKARTKDVAGSKPPKMQQLMDMVLTCKRNAENEVRREEGGKVGELKSPAKKRRMEQKIAERTLAYLRALQERSGWDKVPVGQASPPPGSLPYVIQSLGLMGVDLQDDGSELAIRLRKLLTGLKHAARGVATRAHSGGTEEMQGESSPFDRLAAKLGLPTNCDIDLRKQDDLEDQTAGSVSSLEGFSPSGDTYHHGGGVLGKSTGGYEDDEDEWEIPWVLTPITGLCSERYTRRERNLPDDPRFHHVAMDSQPDNHTPYPGLGPARSPSPECIPPPSPEPSPPLRLEPHHPLSPSRRPTEEPSRLESPAGGVSHRISSLPLPPLSWSPLKLNGQNNTEEPRFASAPPRECAGSSKSKEEMDISSIKPSIPPSFESLTSPTERREHNTEEEIGEVKEVHLSMEGNQSHLDVKLQNEDIMDVVDLTESPPGGHVNSERAMTQGPPISSPPARSLEAINKIFDKHLLHFCSDLQLLLQTESIQCNLPQTSSAPQTPTQNALPFIVVAPFSQYVSLYHPSPPVQRYVTSLQDGISSMLRDYNNEGTEPEAALASTVSAFVSSIRAANTRGDEDVSASGEPTPHNVHDLDTQRTTLSKESEVRSSETPGGQFSDPPNRSPPPGDFSTAEPTSSTVAAPHAHRPPQTTSTSHVDLSVPPSTQLISVSTSSLEPPPQVCRQDSSSETLHQASALSSVIRQLKPELLNNLCEIIKDVQRSSTLQFYVHSSQPDDQLSQDIKEYLSEQGHMEQNPVAFLKQEVSDCKLLVVILNKDIEEHIHQIPGLVSLKQHQSVAFLGVNTVDDMRNNTYEELFVCGGCVIPEDLILNPDLVPPNQLAALLTLLDQRNSPENVWRWMIHSKPLKKLKEQARFRRDAASLLDILISYQKQQIVEFLPPHHCDQMNQQSPDLDCLIRHQAQNTRFRHTIFLTVHCLDFMKYSKSGIIAAGVAELLGNFSALLGHHDDVDKQPIKEDQQSSKGTLGQLPRDHDDNVNAGNPTGRVSEQPDSAVSHTPDQLVPEASFQDGEARHSDKDLHMLQMAISHLRAKRQQECMDAEADMGGSPAAKKQALWKSDDSAEFRSSTLTSSQNAAADPGEDATEEKPDQCGRISTDVVSSLDSCPVEGDTLRDASSNKTTSSVTMVTQHPQKINPGPRHPPPHRCQTPSHSQAPPYRQRQWSSEQHHHPHILPSHLDLRLPPSFEGSLGGMWRCQRQQTGTDFGGLPGGYRYPARQGHSRNWGWHRGGGGGGGRGFNGM
uniref:protein TASOR isoform X2 n=1 Tax=Doryrhamphus excisus TaxID=161450 RepID=UPI0025AE5273|nr:protein TASOR isoform X2 [Doryrhamphus excisus]